MGERYANALASVSVRRRLDTRILKLLHNYGLDYAESLKMNKEMWEDSFAFQKKCLGDKRFRRYATLSLTYSDASPLRMVLRILKDAKYTRDYDSMLRKMGDFNEEYDSELRNPYLFWELREEEKKAAFYADVRGNGIEKEHVNAILQRIGYEKLHCRPMIDEVFDQLGAISSLYRFFEGQRGREYKGRMREEKDPGKRSELVKGMADAFFEAYRSDKTVNPDLQIGDYLFSSSGKKAKVLGYGEDYKAIVEPVEIE
ncbi:MAG: hypothetical protein NTY20_03850 [Candidatus Aenigmarchaeota archaeon]|nr:hypothetical protein [Candidatus Aenigmarchaeota archaeon]